MSQCTHAIRTGADLVEARLIVSKAADQAELSTIDKTKLATAASELARNMLFHGGGGIMVLEVAREEGRNVVRVWFKDSGPGIANVDQAMRDGFSTAGSLGLGLPGTKRLVDEFDINSTVGAGTTVRIAKWRR